MNARGEAGKREEADDAAHVVGGLYTFAAAVGKFVMLVAAAAHAVCPSALPHSLPRSPSLPPSLDLVKSENNFDVRTGGGWIVGTTDSLKRPPFVSKGKSPKCRKNEECRQMWKKMEQS